MFIYLFIITALFFFFEGIINALELTLQNVKEVNTVPIPVPVGMYRTDMYTGIETPTFRTGLNTDHTGHTGQFRAILAGTKKSFFFFEFLLGQNGNLFALTY